MLGGSPTNVAVAAARLGRRAGVIRVPLFWTTGTGLSDEPSRSTTLAALRARTDGITVHDLDHRAMFWASKEDARALGREALAHATVAVGNASEVAASFVRSRRAPRLRPPSWPSAFR